MLVFTHPGDPMMDPFTLQYVAGHDTIKTTMRYVRPRADAVHKLFVRLAGLDREKMAEQGLKWYSAGAKSGAD